MSKTVLFAGALCLCVVLSAGGVFAANYAVLVAGSNGYYNYRHQADVCHAFQLLTDKEKGGFPVENVIVFMYDDIANNTQNPFQNNIINHPNGPNVYPGVTKDYTGTAVNPANFIAVITGDKDGVKGGSGRVLETTAEDNIFIYFADHGAPGLIAFPSSFLYADTLMGALRKMHTKNMYKELVFYIEACESGSMFANGKLPSEGLNIFATTAATPSQSSYACYYDQSRKTYLGDEYSVRWLENSDYYDSSTTSWTLEEQYKLVASEVKQSQPQQYGQMSISQESIDHFQGYDDNAFKNNTRAGDQPAPTPCGSAVSSRDVKLDVLRRRYRDETDEAKRAELLREIREETEARARADALFGHVANQLASSIEHRNHILQHKGAVVNDFDCLRASVDAVEQECEKFNDYSLKWISSLVNMCESGITADNIRSAARTWCN